MAKSKLAGVSIDALQAEIERRRRAVSSVISKRNSLLAQLAKIDAVLAAAGVSPSDLTGSTRGKPGPKPGPKTGRRVRGGRARNEQSLSDALVALLKDGSMTVIDMVKKVQDAGYKTTSPNFRTIVNQTLIKDNRFKRVGRGEYAVK